MRELFHHFINALSADEIAHLKEVGTAATAQEGTVFSTAPDASALRRSTIGWVTDEDVKSLLWSFVSRANEASFDVDVTPQADVQFTSYFASEHGHYDWHHDIYRNEQGPLDRKLSVTIPLSDPASYEGGIFEFDEVKTTADFAALGSVLVFPSYLRHRVSPVTKGVRHSLVAWFSGPRWR